MVGMVAVLSAIAAAAPVPKQKQVTTSFFPTAVGTRWVYNDNGGDRDLTRFIGEAKKKGDETTLIINTILPKGEIVFDEELIVSPKGMFVRKFTEAQVCNPPFCRLKYPSSPGDSWEIKCLCFENKLEGTVKVCEQEVIEVPAGKFNAFRVDWKGTGKNQDNTCWYVAGIGSVKEFHRAEVARLSVERVLKSFTPGKP
jgi:hypothetical protein